MDEPESGRSSLGAGILAAIVLCGSALGVMIYQLTQKDKAEIDAGGFDLSRTQEAKAPAAAAAGSPGAAPSSLGLLHNGGLGGIRVGEGAGAQPRPEHKAGSDFTAAVRKSEAKVRNLAMAYTRRYPVIAQYGRDWMSYPDLKKLNDDYMRDHDPIAFLRGLAHAKNFGKLVSKYAGQPAVQDFVKAGVKQAPAEVTASAMAVLKEDALVKRLVANTAASLGLPPALTAGLLGGGSVDEQQVMGQIMQGNPDVKKAMQDPAPPRP
ncbi:MAG: hypothetical protein WC881_04690 [Elusimicrobiota bacterium]|jgi:hypothetical protein